MADAAPIRAAHPDRRPEPDPAPAPDPAVDAGTGVGRTPRVLVVDADDRTRESLCGILAIRHRYEIVGDAGQVGAALALVAEHRPDAILVDPRLPDLPDGIALIRRIRAIHPTACILAVGWTPGLEHVALEAGADGFVRKTFKPGDLSGAIERCLLARPTAPARA
jgi:DNA-binding NarL/FixJ family response regulator